MCIFTNTYLDPGTLDPSDDDQFGKAGMKFVLACNGGLNLRLLVLRSLEAETHNLKRSDLALSSPLRLWTNENAQGLDLAIPCL